MTIRQHLDISYIVAEIIKGTPNKEIARREKARLRAIGKSSIANGLTKNVLIGVKRDLKQGKIPLHHPKDAATYVYGVEEDNGGIPVYTGELDILHNNVLILNDIHFPYTSWKMMDKVIRVLSKLGDNVLTILAGDILNGSAISKWSKLIEAPLFRQEVQAAREGLEEIFQLSEQVVYFRGNHEDWYLFQNNGAEDFTTFAERVVPDKYKNKAIISPYDKMWITSGGERWLVAHQRNASSSNKLKVAEDLSWKYQCHVITTHQHKNGIGRDKYDNFTIASLGGLHDPAKTPYVSMKTSTGPVQEQGFGTLRDGRLQLWTPEPTITNWDW
jgi:predicted phosphodiesterase